MTDKKRADEDWYFAKSRELNLTPRCPFTSVESCPRYYASLSLLAEVEGTKIDKDDELLAYWKKSDLWPLRNDPFVSSSSHKPHYVYTDFCPEISYDRFGYFVADLFPYSDENEEYRRHNILLEKQVPRNDWRWRWAETKSLHYSECPLYAPLTIRNNFSSKLGVSPIETSREKEEPLNNSGQVQRKIAKPAASTTKGKQDKLKEKILNLIAKILEKNPEMTLKDLKQNSKFYGLRRDSRLSEDERFADKTLRKWIRETKKR